MDTKLKNSKTYQNLLNAFAGESQASARYKMLRDQAYKKDLNELAKFIDMVSTNEYYHARAIYSFIESASDGPMDNEKICSGYPFKERLEDFEENFRLAAEDEYEEATHIYPTFAKTAEEEGFKNIAALFRNLVQVETCHNLAFTELYNELKENTMYNRAPAIKWKCAKCGFEATSEHAWKKCPICGSCQGDVMLEMPN